ncbi:MAG: dihydropteroate synthase [bacterium]
MTIWNLHLSKAESSGEARARMERIGADEHGISAMQPKLLFHPLKLESVPADSAVEIKKELVGMGGDAAISHEAYEKKAPTTDVLMMGTADHYANLARRLQDRENGLSELSSELSALLSRIERQSFRVKAGEHVLSLGEKPVFMGIINCTPDSFYDGGKFHDPEKAIARGRELISEGAAILDIGGESTRPGAEAIPAAEELDRVLPVIRGLAGSGALISIDTSKAEVARQALKAGAGMINDVSALADPDMAGVAADSGAAVVLMHMLGTPRIMQKDPSYRDLFAEIIAYLEGRMESAVKAGVSEDSLIVDPGIGFGKTVAHNLELLRDLWRLRSLGRPILLGASNKSFIGKVLGVEADDRREGTAAALTAGVLSGAHIFRIHEVAFHKRFVEMAWAIKNGERRS